MMQASFCFFSAPMANCVFSVWVPQCEEKCRCPEGCNPFGSGFPIGASSTLLAHDFARQSLVCYTFCDRDAGKELSPYRTDHFLWQQKDGYLQAQEACGYSFFGCRRCSKAQVEDRNCAASPGSKRYIKPAEATRPRSPNTTTAVPTTRYPGLALRFSSLCFRTDENASPSP